MGAEGLVPDDVLAELLAVTDSFVEAGRVETESGNVFDIGPGHSAEQVTGSPGASVELLPLCRCESVYATSGPILSCNGTDLRRARPLDRP